MFGVIGADIGTEGTKLVVVDETGRIVAKAYSSYTFDVPKSGWAEQNPEVWWEAFLECLKKLWADGISANDIVGIGVAGQMHSSVLLGENGNIVTKSILWNDNRTKNICDEVLDLIGREHYQGETCNSLLPGFTLGKLLWLRVHDPDAFHQIRHVLMPKDFINFRLTGCLSADVTDASGTGIFDVRKRNWNRDLMNKLDIPHSWFPNAFESSEVVGKVSEKASRITGLIKGIPVIAGAADNASASIGMGIVGPECGLVSIGTSGVVLSCLESAPTFEQAMSQNPTLHVFCHAVPGMWYAMGVTLAAGASLRWFKDTFGFGASYDDLMDQAAKVECGSGGLIYLPFLTGERTPYNSDRLRGGFLGINLQHQPAHFVRSVIEGVSYSLRDCLDLIRPLKQESSQFVVTGGVVNSPLWLQVLTDVLETPLKIKSYSEGAAFGAALLVGLSQGLWNDLDNVFDDEVNVKQYLMSNNIELYKKEYRRYKAFANALIATTVDGEIV